MTAFKIPESVLVVVYTPQLDVLLLERTDSPGFWQSVTGSREPDDKSFAHTAAREVFEETGIQVRDTDAVLSDWCVANVYDIYPVWRHRYAPGVTRNTEHVFGLCLPAPRPVLLHPAEHTSSRWMPYLAAADGCFSPSNAEAILMLPRWLH